MKAKITKKNEVQKKKTAKKVGKKRLKKKKGGAIYLIGAHRAWK